MATVLDRFMEGDVRALSRVVSVVENRTDGYREILAKLYEKSGQSLRIGITGPPGAGKSTLVNSLARQFVADGKRVGIVAVDPTSPFTGGALLGDRVRMEELPTDGTVYFRSMATRGASGGLAAATDNVCIVYDAFGFDITLIETVGVGQVELDIIDTCDSVVVVLVPESGDAVQTMKAGLIEIADLFCINKSDRPGAERIAAELKHSLEVRHRSDDTWTTPIVPTEALNNKNVDRLYESILAHFEYAKSSGVLQKHRREQIRRKVRSIMRTRFQRELDARFLSELNLDEIIDDICDGKSNPFDVGDRLYDKFCRG
ncbi:MAG: methylmalonyl Co-A mutase-associated GTPase MeaB [Candidatus Zixiibacteriota bacterium]|nr:MAG: methylmalonyl Co-A mutase-associated GTPase MeaB [candidate division Zixibacteria bacterium]